ncbi:CAAX protease self-immunity-domain-containing protein [Pisolithus tinctorius]|nr:CAAX protease self-immunity-domain-containing protein [Pisolithus tinctorius]
MSFALQQAGVVSRLSNSLGVSSAHALAAVYTTLYVGSIYLSKGARLSFSKAKAYIDFGYSRPKEMRERWRDDPDVIRARLVAVSIATIICCVMAAGPVREIAGNEPDRVTLLRLTLSHLGITFSGLLPFLVTPVLYLGPLYSRFLVGTLPFQRNWTYEDDFVSVVFSVTGIRNYVVAPITEEVVFRACVLSAYHLANASKARMILLSPLAFGAAHIHHAWETYNRYGRSPAALKRAAIGTAFQFAYTTVFGFYCSYLFLRTGSVLPPIAAHVFCNVMGVPQPGYDIGQRPDRKLAIILAYLSGISLFVYVLQRWTYTEESLFWS